MNRWAELAAERRRRLGLDPNGSIGSNGRIVSEETGDTSAPEAGRSIGSNDSIVSRQRLAAPQPDDIQETAARLEYEEGLPRALADRVALSTAGYQTWDEAEAALRRHVEEALGDLPSLVTPDGERLLRFTRRFLVSPWFGLAVREGWTLVDLFGVAAFAPRQNVGALGLVPSVCWGSAPVEIEVLTSEGAKLRTRTGAVQTFRRGAPAMDNSVEWWSCSALVRTVNYGKAGGG